jgi:hypothetical protein
MPDPPRPARGRAIRRTAEERDHAATVTAADVLAARMEWHRRAVPGWQGLIEAKVEPPKDE